jgi:hypothetical protein
VTPEAVLQFLLYSLVDGTTASIFGVGTKLHLILGSHSLTIALASSLALALIVSSVYIGRADAAVLWSAYFGYFLIAQLPIAVARAGTFGPDSGLSLRYNVDTTAYMVLVIALAHARLRLDSVHARMVPLAAALLVAINLQARTGGLGDPPYPSLSAVRAYMTHLRESLDRQRGQNIVVLDAPVPHFILIPTLAPPFDWHRTPAFLKLLPPSVRTGNENLATHYLREDGEVVAR